MRPLTSLEAAISQRDTRDLRTIRPTLPDELSGLVSTLNLHFDRLHRSIASKDVFISNAAHPLRNPVAGVLSLAQSLRSAPDMSDWQDRVGDLVVAARHARRLTTQLLSYERAQPDTGASHRRRVDGVASVRAVMDRVAPGVLRTGIDLSFEPAVDAASTVADDVLLGEAIDNLIDNACRHGGSSLTRITVRLAARGRSVEISVCDDGKGVPADQHDKALSRFSLVSVGSGSGLGLPSAASAAKSMGGELMLSDGDPGLCVTILLPRQPFNPRG